MTDNIIIAGDPHGHFHQIVEAIKSRKAKHVVILGDIEAHKPLDVLIPRELGAEVWYIRGNHEHENKLMWENIIESSYGPNDLSGRVVSMDGILVGGLSGVFDREIWYPPDSEKFQSLEQWASMSKYDKWFDSKKTKHEAGTIFPEDYYKMAELKCDVLVSHEAPDCHPYGFSAINELASFTEAKYLFHGHHHDNLDYSAHEARMGFKAHGVGLAGIKNVYGAEVTPGIFDQERNEIRARKMRA